MPSVVRLELGDALIIADGVAHGTKTTDAASGHITIGAYERSYPSWSFDVIGVLLKKCNETARLSALQSFRKIEDRLVGRQFSNDAMRSITEDILSVMQIAMSGYDKTIP
jgi:hypothetical protein